MRGRSTSRSCRPRSLATRQWPQKPRHQTSRVTEILVYSWELREVDGLGGEPSGRHRCRVSLRLMLAPAHPESAPPASEGTSDSLFPRSHRPALPETLSGGGKPVWHDVVRRLEYRFRNRIDIVRIAHVDIVTWQQNQPRRPQLVPDLITTLE